MASPSLAGARPAGPAARLPAIRTAAAIAQVATAPVDIPAVPAATAAAAAATDIATITGSATKTIYVQRVIITGVQTTAGLAEVLLIKAVSSGYSPLKASEGVDYAVSLFPYDQHLRSMRENVDKQLHARFGRKLP